MDRICRSGIVQPWNELKMTNTDAMEQAATPETCRDERFEVASLTLDEWQQFVQSHPASTAFHHRHWIELLISQYGGRLIIPAVMHGSVVAAAMPFMEAKSLSGKRRLICLPYTDCLRVLSSSNDDAAALFHAATSLAGEGYESVVVRTGRRLGAGHATSDNVRHILDTGRSFEEIEANYDKGLLRNLRKAASNGLCFQRRTDLDAMREFYRLHVATRVKHGVPVQPRSFFRRLHERMIRPGLGFVGLVEKDGCAIAAGVFLSFKKTMIYKYGASDPRALEHRPNELLMHSALRLAHQDECSCFDFGVSARSNEGLRRFKRKWGAVESDAFHVYLAGSPRSNIEDSRALKFASLLIRHSPAVVCRGLGELFYRYSQ
jgi:hypothetical protein